MNIDSLERNPSQARPKEKTKVGRQTAKVQRRPMAVQSGWKASLERLVKKAAVPVAKFGIAVGLITGGAHHYDKNLGGGVGEIADSVGSTAVEVVTDNVIKPAVDIVAEGVGQVNEYVKGISRDYKPTSFYTGDGTFNFSNAIFTTSKGEPSGPSMPNGFDRNNIIALNGQPINAAVVQNGLQLELPAFSHDGLSGVDYLEFRAATSLFSGEITLFVNPRNPQYGDARVLTLKPGGRIQDIAYDPEGNPIITLGSKRLSLSEINVVKPVTPQSPITP